MQKETEKTISVLGARVFSKNNCIFAKNLLENETTANLY